MCGGFICGGIGVLIANVVNDAFFAGSTLREEDVSI